MMQSRSKLAELFDILPEQIRESVPNGSDGVQSIWFVTPNKITIRSRPDGALLKFNKVGGNWALGIQPSPNEPGGDKE